VTLPEVTVSWTRTCIGGRGYRAKNLFAIILPTRLPHYRAAAPKTKFARRID